MKVKVLVPQSSIPGKSFFLFFLLREIKFISDLLFVLLGMFVLILPWLYSPLVWCLYNIVFQLMGNIYLLPGLRIAKKIEKHKKKGGRSHIEI